MQRRGLKVEAYISLNDRPDLETWTWWHTERAALSDRLRDSQEPVLFETNAYLQVTWIVSNRAQLELVIDFLYETRKRFALDRLPFHYYTVTFDRT